MENKQVKEPIRKLWIWVVLVLILVFSVPWYLPKGAIEPIIFGFPYWALISVIGTLVLSAYLSYLCTHEWNIVEDEEEGKNGGAAS